MKWREARRGGVYVFAANQAILFACAALGLTPCMGSTRSLTCLNPQPGYPSQADRDVFVSRFAAVATEAARRSGVPVSGLLAIAIHESGFGFNGIAPSSMPSPGPASCAFWSSAGNLHPARPNAVAAFASAAAFLGLHSRNPAYAAATRAYQQAIAAGISAPAAVRHWLNAIQEAGFDADPQLASAVIRLANNYRNPSYAPDLNASLYQFDAPPLPAVSLRPHREVAPVTSGTRPHATPPPPPPSIVKPASPAPQGLALSATPLNIARVQLALDELQDLKTHRPMYHATVSGRIDANTLAALNHFAEKHVPPLHGVVWNSPEVLSAVAITEIPPATAPPRSVKTIKKLQLSLVQKHVPGLPRYMGIGIDLDSHHPPSGLLDPGTIGAILVYQFAKGLTQTGVPDDETLADLGVRP